LKRNDFLHLRVDFRFPISVTLQCQDGKLS